MGLAWTSMGGSTLYVECANLNGGPRMAGDKETELSVGRVRSTGQLGDVMSESLSIAHSFATRFLNKYARDNLTLQSEDLQLHVPEGATPKDGPSAGECCCACWRSSLSTASVVCRRYTCSGMLSSHSRCLLTLCTRDYNGNSVAFTGYG